MSAPRLGRILVVDDEQTVRDVLCEYFTEQGYDVAGARDGTEALAVLKAHRSDLVLLDIRMPGIDGVATRRRIREAAPAVAVIMVTANEDVTLARETLSLGALDYVAKPFDFAYLERAVMTGLMHVVPEGGGAAATAPRGDDPWRRLAAAVFRLVRDMSDSARASVGVRLEDAALRAAREGTAGVGAAAAAALAELELLTTMALDLRDVGPADLLDVRRALAD